MLPPFHFWTSWFFLVPAALSFLAHDLAVYYGCVAVLSTSLLYHGTHLWWARPLDVAVSGGCILFFLTHRADGSVKYCAAVACAAAVVAIWHYRSKTAANPLWHAGVHAISCAGICFLVRCHA